jgi:hypothetical protein
MTFVPFDPFFSAKLRFRRAQEHLTQFVREEHDFFAENPGGYACEPDTDGAYQIHKIKFTKRFPPRWSVLATEIVEHFRSSLDHAAFATFLADRGPDAKSNFAAFPIAKTAPDLERGIKGRSKDLREEILSVIRGLQPYKGGNDALYTLNELCNVSKHGLITLMAGAISSFELSGFETAQGTVISKSIQWDSIKNEIEYARSPIDAHGEHEGKVTVYITLGDIDWGKDINASRVFDEMRKEVGRTIGKIEAEARRIGIIR